MSKILPHYGISCTNFLTGFTHYLENLIKNTLDFALYSTRSGKGLEYAQKFEKSGILKQNVECSKFNDSNLFLVTIFHSIYLPVPENIDAAPLFT